MQRILSLAALSALAASAAQAQIATPQVYGSVGYTQKDQSDLDAVQLRLGARFGSYFGVEGEFAKGVKSRTDSSVAAGFDVKTKLRYEAAAYVVGYLPLSPKADLFARVGYGRTWLGVKGDTPVGPLDYKYDESSVNWGGGGQYFFDEKNGVRVDYIRQDSQRSRSQDVWTVAYTRRF